jgi:hypothetical protein
MSSKLKLICCDAKLWKGQNCKCKQIRNIQEYTRRWLNGNKILKQIKYNKDTITYNCINSFQEKDRSKNDSNNIKRENIIGSIINEKIPEEYYTRSLRWANLKKQINSYIKILCEKDNIKNIDKKSCIHKAGRSNNFDFIIIINDNKEYNVEFKYNVECVNETPQFVSPMKPSKYINKEFEPWFYDNYLTKIVKYGNLKMPQKDEYCKKIHNNEVECMKEIKKKYDTDNNFNKYCKQIDKEAIKIFIQDTEIDKNTLSNYLMDSQANKHYMCYSKNKIYYDTVNKDLYKVNKLIKKENTNYIYQTETGMNLEIKLRFKNGCGIQFPAFQIKRKIPLLSRLKEICETNNIKLPNKSLKKDIVNILEQHNIVY